MYGAISQDLAGNQEQWLAKSVVNATGKLKKAFEKAKTPSGTVDNVIRVHSHRTHTMLGHLANY